jgi:integral membrane protein (TIGR01906 family)
MKNNEPILKIILSIILILAAFKFIGFNDFIINHEQEKLDINVTNSQQTIDFIKGKSNLPQIFSEKESTHMYDVRFIYFIGNSLFYLCLIIFGIMLYLNKKPNIKEVFSDAAKYTLAIIVILLIFAILDFDALFTVFHQIFFSGDSWLFSQDSALIRMFPLDFFIAITQNIFLFIILICFIIIKSTKNLNRTKLLKNK